MKKQFLSVSFSFIFFFIVFCCFVNIEAEAKTKPVLSKTRIVLDKKRNCRIEVKHPSKKVKWTVTNKKLLKIKAYGKKKQKLKIWAKKKTGKGYVIAKVGKRTLKCRIIVKNTEKEKRYPLIPLPETTETPIETQEKNSVDDCFVNAMSKTGFSLLQNNIEPDKKENILISPDSIFTCVAMTANGTDGITKEEMEKALGNLSIDTCNKNLMAFHKNLSSSPKTRYQSANSIWYRKDTMNVKSAFAKTVSSYYQAELYPFTFNSNTVKQINAWVSNKTNKKINSILDRLEPSDRMFLINAVYYKGEWSTPYHGTVEKTFTNANGSKKKAKMLEGSENTYFPLMNAEGFTKPYFGGDTAFFALLPPEGVSAEDYVNSFSGEEFIQAYKNRQREDILVHTRIPEFEYSYQASQKEPLMKMGVNSAFSNHANFKAMTDTSVMVDDVLHKTYIKLDKNGTEAAAVTSTLVKATSAYQPPKKEKTIYLDRPFVYGILDTDTGIPLFLGIFNHF